MILVRIIIIALPEKRKEVLQTLLSILEPSGKKSEFLSYDIFSDIEDENVFSLISRWESRRELDRHMKSDRFSVLLGSKSLLCEPLKIEIFTISASEGMEAVHLVRKKRN